MFNSMSGDDLANFEETSPRNTLQTTPGEMEWATPSPGWHCEDETSSKSEIFLTIPTLCPTELPHDSSRWQEAVAR